MKALVYHGAMEVRIDEKAKLQIKDKEDFILKVTSTANGGCGLGFDLHLYPRTIPIMEPGRTQGHEFIGIVEEPKPCVHTVKECDRFVIPFNLLCCKGLFCRQGSWSQSDRTNRMQKLYLKNRNYHSLFPISIMRMHIDYNDRG